MAELKLFTLNTTQELIGKVVADEGNALVIEDLLWVRAVQTGPNDYGLQMDQFSLSNPDGKIRIYKHAIVSEVVDIPAGLQTAYTRQTSSIEIVSSIPGLK